MHTVAIKHELKDSRLELLFTNSTSKQYLNFISGQQGLAEGREGLFGEKRKG